MTHLYYNNKSAGQLLSEIETAQSNISLKTETGTVFLSADGTLDGTSGKHLDAGAYTTTVVDMKISDNNYYKDLTIYGYTKRSTSKLHFAVSVDNTNYFIMSDYATLTTIGTEYHFVHSLKDCSFRYIKIYNSDVSDTDNGTKLYYIQSSHS